MMVQSGKRLQNALLLQTHLEQIAKDYLPEAPKGKPDKKQLSALSALQSTCFVCDKIDWGMAHMFETVFRSFENDESFRALFTQQEYICLPHYTQLMQAAMGKTGSLQKAAGILQGGGIACGRISQNAWRRHIPFLYDVRLPQPRRRLENSKDAIERAVTFLTGRKMESSDS